MRSSRARTRLTFMGTMGNMALTSAVSAGVAGNHGGNHAAPVEMMPRHVFQIVPMFFTIFSKPNPQVSSMVPMFFTSPRVWGWKRILVAAPHGPHSGGISPGHSFTRDFTRFTPSRRSTS